MATREPDDIKEKEPLEIWTYKYQDNTLIAFFRYGRVEKVNDVPTKPEINWDIDVKNHTFRLEG
jgi:hypothetical protein